MIRNDQQNLKKILIDSAQNSAKSFPIIAFGSSIVEVYMGCGGYHNWIDLISNTVRFSFGKNIVFINQGIGGNTIIDLNERLNRDVLSYQPIATIIAVGGNCAKVPIDLDIWSDQFRKLIERTRNSGIHPVVCSYFYQDFDVLPSHFSIYREYRNFLMKSSAELNFEFVDIFPYFENLARKIENYRAEILRNELHVNPVGNALMAYIFCRLTDLPIPVFNTEIGKKVEEFSKKIGI